MSTAQEAQNALANPTIELEGRTVTATLASQGANRSGGGAGARTTQSYYNNSGYGGGGGAGSYGGAAAGGYGMYNSTCLLIYILSYICMHMY